MSPLGALYLIAEEGEGGGGQSPNGGEDLFNFVNRPIQVKSRKTMKL